MNNRNQMMNKTGGSYREESGKLAAVTMLLLVCAIALPMGWMAHLNRKQSNSSNEIKKYSIRAEALQSEIMTIQQMLKNEVLDDELLIEVATAPGVALIATDDVQVNEKESDKNKPKKLNVELNAIYWNPESPLITIGKENYKVGEKIQGFTIVEIRKTEVVFQSPLGEEVVKYFYDYLDRPGKK